MKAEKELHEKMQEFQLAQQNLQNLSLQRQAFQIELNEAESALEESGKAEGDMYRIVGNIMIKAEKEKIIKELQDKKEILALRIKTLENQERILEEKLEKMRRDLEEKLKIAKK